MLLQRAQADTLRALLDRLIPADDYAGALEAGVDRYVLGQLEGDCRHEAAGIAAGLTQLDHEAIGRIGRHFADLARAQQDDILRELEAARPATMWPREISGPAFFQRMVELAHEGFYADPENGGNAQAISWRMIGYDPHLPAQPADRSDDGTGVR